MGRGEICNSRAVKVAKRGKGEFSICDEELYLLSLSLINCIYLCLAYTQKCLNPNFCTHVVLYLHCRSCMRHPTKPYPSTRKSPYLNSLVLMQHTILLSYLVTLCASEFTIDCSPNLHLFLGGKGCERKKLIKLGRTRRRRLFSGLYA